MKPLTQNLVNIALSVAIISLSALISVPVFTIPVTLQTFSVTCIALLLGPIKSTIAVAIYILLGLVGVPVFSGFSSGIPALLGPTGGYIFGFLLLSSLSGVPTLFHLKSEFMRYFLGIFFMLLGLACCYAFGTVWFMYVYTVRLDKTISLSSALTLCVVPYIIPDLMKLLLAYFVASRRSLQNLVTPKKP